MKIKANTTISTPSGFCCSSCLAFAFQNEEAPGYLIHTIKGQKPSDALVLIEYSDALVLIEYHVRYLVFRMQMVHRIVEAEFCFAFKSSDPRDAIHVLKLYAKKMDFR